jgi:hypothetical protein
VRLRARVSLPIGSISGLSGLARDDQGRLWAVPERKRRLIPLRVSGKKIEIAGQPIPIDGLKPGWDSESIAYLHDDTFALGTETQRGNRQVDHVVMLRLEGGRGKVVETVVLDYSMWGMRAQVNRGIEGLCHVDGILIAANENIIVERDQRWAPVARLDLTTRQWTPFRLALGSSSGKLSAVTCRPSADADTLEVLAIERHYGVSRLLHLRLPTHGPGGDLRPTLIANLAALVRRVPNLEGLSWLTHDRLIALVDNDTSGLTGPNEAWVLDLSE